MEGRKEKKGLNWEFIMPFIFLFYKSCNISFYYLLFHHLSPISHWKQLPPKWTRPSTNLIPNEAALQWGPQSWAPLQTNSFLKFRCLHWNTNFCIFDWNARISLQPCPIPCTFPENDYIKNSCSIPFLSYTIS